MSNSIITSRGAGTFEMSGNLTFQTVPEFQAQAGSLFEGGAHPVTVDMKGVSQADSAGLALMIEWLQSARNAKCQLEFTNIPEQVHDLIRVNGLTQVFESK